VELYQGGASRAGPYSPKRATLASHEMERLIRIYGMLLRVVVIVVLFLLFLQIPWGIVGWYWPCEWAWQPFHFNPNCGLSSGDYGD
jgi:hypothetical protein